MVEDSAARCQVVIGAWTAEPARRARRLWFCVFLVPESYWVVLRSISVPYLCAWCRSCLIYENNVLTCSCMRCVAPELGSSTLECARAPEVLRPGSAE